jgi:hypothetical protein
MKHQHEAPDLIAAFDPGEKQGRALSPVNPALYGGDLEVRINLFGNADEFPSRLQLSQALRKILIAHSLFLLLQIKLRIPSTQPAVDYV